ncbi:MAG: hypothetical protein HQK81_06715 [Desulfovibrionaceae bacterium]|nr:hypothetical protein [Desulfovibrionaceae bacterium]MBF0513742.1 hypothetical protein [Desulfovibrionaceae bacterium]
MMDARLKKMLKISLSLAVILLVVVLVFTYKAKFWIFDPDILYLPYFAHDLYNSSFSITNWQISTTPYFFPDLLLYLVIYPFVDYGTSIGLYLVIVYLSNFFLLLLIKREVNTKAEFIDDFLNFSIFSLICILILYNSQTLLWSLLMPVFHGGSILNGLIAILLFLKILKSKSKLLEVILYLHIIISSFSDPLVVAQFYIPLAVIAILAWICRFISTVDGGRMSLLVLAASFLGIISQKILTRLGIFTVYSRLKYREITDIFREFSHSYFSLFDSSHIANICIIISFSTLTVFSLYFLRSRSSFLNRYRNDLKAKYALIIFPFLSIIAFIFAHRFTSPFPITVAHGIILYFVPLASIFVLISMIKSTYHPIIRVFFTMFISILFVSHVGELKFSSNDEFIRNYYPNVAALDEVSQKYNLKYGLTDYWTAKPWSFLSHTSIFINQLNKNFEPDFWVTNADWFIRDKGHNGYPEYNFIIAKRTPGDVSGENLPVHMPGERSPSDVTGDRLSDDIILEKFGAPRVRVNLDDYTAVFIYDRDSDMKFRNFLKIKLFQYLHRSVDFAQPKNNRLKLYKEDGSSWDKGLKLSRGAEYVVDFDHATAGNVLETSLSGECSYNISVHAVDDSQIAALNIPKGVDGVLARHFLCVKKANDSRQVAYLKVVPVEDNDKCGIGDAFIYEDAFCKQD